MKILGIILIVGGIAMLIFRGISVQKEEKVLDVGPIEVNKKENKWLTWPTYAGAIAIVAGIIVLGVGSKKRSAA